ncbi:TonB-dependent receptor [uncultured Hymenobacter sp.]|uniref:TonB-dependent receptor n=1 Tax=uncultured Hymenobacter sp. TaxID=170016 RepID=UPI0035CB30A7
MLPSKLAPLALLTGLLSATIATTAAQSSPPPAAPTPSRAVSAAFAGRITDEATGQGLPGATILFPDLRQVTVSDSAGSFQFARLPRGRFLMQVRYVGYNTLSQTVATGTGQPLTVALRVAATEIGQVVVTGVSQATELRRSPVPTSVVDRQRLNQTAATNIVDALARVPGVSQITTGAAISKPVIRGLSANRVITLNNGARQEGQQWGDEHGIEIDEFSIDRAEIIKGPGSLLYGSDGMAGVVNFLAPDPVDEGRITGQVAANYQTNNHLRGYSLQNAGNLNGFNWLARGSLKGAGAYRNAADGRVFNSGFNEQNANAYVGLNKSWGFSHLTFSTFNQEIGLVEGSRDPVSGRFTREVDNGRGEAETREATAAELRGYNLVEPRQRVNHLRLGTDNNFILGEEGGRLTVQVNYQQNRRREFGDAVNFNTPGLYFDLRTVDYSLRYFLPEVAGWNFTTGLSGLHQQNQNRGREFLIPAYRTDEGGVFGVARKAFGRLDVSGGLRYDRRRTNARALYLDANEEPVSAGTAGAETRFGGFRSTFQNVSGSVGGSFSATDKLVLKANLSRGFRAPNIAELGSNGQHEGTIRYEIGEPGLRAETSLQADLGASYVTDHVSLSLNAFRNNIANYIFPRKLESQLGGDSLAATGDPVFRFGQGAARLYGGEASLDLHPHPLDWLHLETSFSLVRAVQKNQPEESKYLPFIPADRLQTELRIQRAGPKGRLAHLYAFVQVEHTFRQNRFFAAFDTETATPGYTLTHAGLGGDLTNAKGRTLASLFLTGNNLFDVAYQSHLSRLKYADFNVANGRRGVFNMGRTISAKLVVPLRLK